MAVGKRPVDHAPATQVGERSRHYGWAESAGNQADDRLHLYGFLGDVEGDARPRRKTRHDIVKAGRDVARHHDEALARQGAHGKAAALLSQPVLGRQRGDEAVTLHDQVLHWRGVGYRGQQHAEIQLAGGERRRLLRGKHFAQGEAHAGMGRLVGLQQPGEHAEVRERHEADAQASLLARGHAAHLEHRALELCQRAPRLVEQAGTLGRELHAPSGASEERDAEARFK